jgi:hypothetical protein
MMEAYKLKAFEASSNIFRITITALNIASMIKSIESINIIM